MSDGEKFATLIIVWVVIVFLTPTILTAIDSAKTKDDLKQFNLCVQSGHDTELCTNIIYSLNKLRK